MKSWIKIFQPNRLKKETYLQTLFKTLLVVGLITVVSAASFLLAPRGVIAAPYHITLTWAADARTTQTITWRTEAAAAPGYVQYAEATVAKAFLHKLQTVTAEMSGLEANGKSISVHSVTLTGLKPGTRYIYRVGDGLKWSERHSFATAASRVPGFKFLIFGDSQSVSYDVWRTTLQQAYQANPDAVFMTNVGDLVDVGLDYGQWSGWFEAGKGVIDTIPVMPVTGNHETYTLDKGFSMPIYFTAQFKLPPNGPAELKGQVYSFDYGDVHFSILDSQAGEEKQFVPNMLELQQVWLEQDLRVTDKPWKIVFIHRPPYHNRPRAGDEHLRAAFVPILDKYHVDAVFAGHDHVYVRSYPLRGGKVAAGHSGGTVYVTTGRSGTKTYSGAAAKEWNEFFHNPLDQPNYLIVEVAKTSLTVKAFKQSGELIDAWTIKKGK